MNNSRNIINTSIKIILALTCIGSFLSGAWSCAVSRTFENSYFAVTLTSLVTIAILHVPDFLKEKNLIAVPAILQTAFSIFTFCAMFLGEIFDFYTRFSWWDTMLHFSSGILFSIAGYLLFVSFNRENRIRRHLNPLSVLLFAICFSIACGVFWEIFEFAGDSLLGMNMQKWQSDASAKEWASMLNDSNFSNPGLINTMKDIIADTLGSICSVVFLLPLVKFNNRYVKSQIGTDVLLEESRVAFSQFTASNAMEQVSIPFSYSVRNADKLTFSKQNTSIPQTKARYNVLVKQNKRVFESQ